MLRLLARWRALDELWRDGACAMLLAMAAALVPAGSGIQWGGVLSREPDALAVVLALGQSLPLAVRRRWPASGLVAIAGAFCGYQMMGYPSTIGSVGLLIALYSVGAYQGRARRGLAVAATLAYALASVAMHRLGSLERPFDYVTFYLLLAACWGNGALVRAWRAGEAERQRHAAAQEVAAERARIARELHDVVTHHVTAMVVQADAAQIALGERGNGLAVISGTGRRALSELRHLLDVLHPPGEWTELVARARLSGQPVELTVAGERPRETGGPELAAYRVVQEGLTNAVKHAPGRRTVVTVHYGREDIDVSVTTDGPTGVAGGGRGIEGLRQRVGLLGGELSATPESGGFVLRARLPLRETG